MDYKGNEHYRSKVTENSKVDVKIYQYEMTKCNKKAYILLYFQKKCNYLWLTRTYYKPESSAGCSKTQGR